MPIDLAAVSIRKPWPGQTAVHLLAMMAAVALVWLARRAVDLAKRLDPEL